MYVLGDTGDFDTMSTLVEVSPVVELQRSEIFFNKLEFILCFVLTSLCLPLFLSLSLSFSLARSHALLLSYSICLYLSRCFCPSLSPSLSLSLSHTYTLSLFSYLFFCRASRDPLKPQPEDMLYKSGKATNRLVVAFWWFCLSVCILCVCLSVYLFVCVCLSVSLFVCKRIRLPMFHSIRLSLCLSLPLFVCLSVCLSFCQSVYLSVCLSVRLSLFQSICLSVCLCLCLFMYLSVCVTMSTFLEFFGISARLTFCLFLPVPIFSFPSITFYPVCFQTKNYRFFILYFLFFIVYFLAFNLVVAHSF